MFQLEQRE
jgi:hypothetical protein